MASNGSLAISANDALDDRKGHPVSAVEDTGAQEPQNSGHDDDLESQPNDHENSSDAKNNDAAAESNAEEKPVKSNGTELSSTTSDIVVNSSQIGIRYTSDHLDGISPPPSAGENFRDGLLRKLDHPVFQYTGILVIFLIIADGAFFFFLLMGWQAMCSDPSRTDCEPRNWWYNWSVQVLTGLFSYMAFESMPWRSVQFLHISGLSCPYRSNATGKDLYGLPTEDVWYHIARWKRVGITILLLLNCLTQFANQATRIIFSDYESQSKPPGSGWTNVFFFGSMGIAFVALVWQLYEEHQLRKRNPGRFAPGLVETLRGYYKNYGCKCCQKTIEPEEQGEEGVRVTDARTRFNFGIPTFPKLPFDRTGLRLWGM